MLMHFIKRGHKKSPREMQLLGERGSCLTNVLLALPGWGFRVGFRVGKLPEFTLKCGSEASGISL